MSDSFIREHFHETWTDAGLKVSSIFQLCRTNSVTSFLDFACKNLFNSRRLPCARKSVEIRKHAMKKNGAKLCASLLSKGCSSRKSRDSFEFIKHGIRSKMEKRNCRHSVRGSRDLCSRIPPRNIIGMYAVK